MVGAIYGSETTIMKKTLVFVQRINTCKILHFSILTMLKMTYNFRNCKVASLDYYQYSCCNQ